MYWFSCIWKKGLESFLNLNTLILLHTYETGIGLLTWSGRRSSSFELVISIKAWQSLPTPSISIWVVCLAKQIVNQVFVFRKETPKIEIKRSDAGPTLETLDFSFYIGDTPTFLYFDLYLNTAYTAHDVYCTLNSYR